VFGVGLVVSIAVADVWAGKLNATEAVGLAPAIALIAAMLLAASRRSSMAILLTSLLGALLLNGPGSSLHGERTFFGTLRVFEVNDGSQRVLIHGATEHGRQRPGVDARVPLAYYARSGPMGDVFAVRGERADEVGVIGLGVGTLAAYGRPGQRFTFFELDPAVVAIASNPAYFTYLKDSRADVKVVVGDGRLSTERMPDATFDLFVVDAFSSDMIPTHLVTREALALYARKVTPDGLIAFNVSSRWFDLAPVVAASAADLGLIAVERRDTAVGERAERGTHSSIWVVVARRRSAIAPLLATGRWKTADPGSGWTDSYSNPLRSLMW
jgi:spermidine synthase